MEILSCVDPASVSKEVGPKVVDVLIIALDCFSFGAVWLNKSDVGHRTFQHPEKGKYVKNVRA